MVLSFTYLVLLFGTSTWLVWKTTCCLWHFAAFCSLSSTKISWSCSRTKRYAVSTYDWATQDNTVEKYRNRPGNMSEMSLLTWLCNVDHAKQQPKEYKSGTTLVRFKLLSILNSQYFFQYFFVHKPHRNLSELQHSQHDKVLAELQWFASAKHHCSDFWENDHVIAEYFHKQGNLNVFITTLSAYIHTLADSYFLVQMQILSPLSIENYMLENTFRSCVNSPTYHFEQPFIILKL